MLFRMKFQFAIRQQVGYNLSVTILLIFVSLLYKNYGENDMNCVFFYYAVQSHVHSRAQLNRSIGSQYHVAKNHESQLIIVVTRFNV